MEDKNTINIEHVDLKHIKENSNGDFVFLSEIYCEFLLELPKKMAAIQMLVKENKKEEILKICHNLVGIFPIFGMETSMKILREINLQLSQNVLDKTIQKQFEELECIINKVLLEIETELSKLS